MPSTILWWSKCSFSEILFLSIIFGDEWISQSCFVPDSTADENGWSDTTKVAEWIRHDLLKVWDLGSCSCLYLTSVWDNSKRQLHANIRDVL